MIRRFRVQNFKSLKDIDVVLSPLHVLIGQNDSGKTSLLEAIYAFCRSARLNKSITEAFEGRWQGRDLVYFQASDPVIKFSASLEGMSSGRETTREYGFSVEFHPDLAGAQVVPQSEWYSHPQSEAAPSQVHSARTLIQQYNPNYTELSLRFQRKASLENSYQVLEEIANLIGSADFYRFDARLMAVPSSIDEKRKFRMDADGFGLSTLLDDILDFDAKKFIQLSQEFCGYFPEFQRVFLQTEMAWNRTYVQTGLHHSGQAPGKGIYFETREGSTVRAQQASDGALLFLGFLSLLYIPTPPKVLLIEEPEKGVYPKRLEEIVGLLKRVIGSAEGRDVPQIIFTTHSPYILSYFQPGEVTLLSRSDDHVIARPLRDAPNIKERLDGGTFYLGELWYNLDEEELFRDSRT